MAEKNQTPQEYFEIVATGRKGVEEMFTKMRPEMEKLAAPNIKPELDTWTTRALVDITSRDELRELLSTRPGLNSVYHALARALTIGLQMGGIVPHAYIMPKGGKAALVPTAEGAEFATVYGPGAVLKWVPDLIAVYELDTLRVDQKAGMYEHDYPGSNPFADRGKLVGFIMQLEYLDGRIRIPHISMADVERVEKYGNPNNPAYQKSPMQMHEKTARKQLLKEPFKEAAGIANKRETEIDFGPDPDPAQPMRNVTERVGDRLDKAAEAMEPPAETTPEPPAPAPQPAKGEPVQKDIF